MYAFEDQSGTKNRFQDPQQWTPMETFQFKGARFTTRK